MTTLTATYSPEDNKLRLYSSTRLDQATYTRVRAAGFIHAPKQDLFVAPKWTPEREDLLLELCGEIGDEDTSLVDRAEERAERFEGYSEHRQADGDAANAATHRIMDGIPLGQPILVGHHSERRARKDAERIENGLRKAVKMWETADYWKRRAAGAISHAKYKERPDVRHRRIKGLESERRKWEKTIKVSGVFGKLWNKPGLTFDQAVAIANRDGVYGPGPGNFVSLWSELTGGHMMLADAVAHAVAHHETLAARCARWVAHLDNRLAYERAMLGESGWTPPPKPKTKADLPLLNYSGTVAYRNPFHKGEIIRTEAVGITKAELAAIHTDYKGTRVSECGTHRVRTAMLRRGGSHDLSIVYLTDSKQHPRPSAEAIEAQAEVEETERQAEAAERLARPRRVVTVGEPTKLDIAKAVLKAGVVAVSAPQLFPTPTDLARRMAKAAGILAGCRVLEPSAGTGNLVRAIVDSASGFDCVRVVAVEVNATLADRLRTQRQLMLYANESNYDIRQADFLTCNGDLGKFDRVLMNPPFEDASDIRHIMHARTFLKPGGCLVAICADGPRQEEKLRPLATTWEPLPAGTFEGTNVRTVMLTIDNT